jgi:hypothetical protein
MTQKNPLARRSLFLFATTLFACFLLLPYAAHAAIFTNQPNLTPIYSTSGDHQQQSLGSGWTGLISSAQMQFYFPADHVGDSLYLIICHGSDSNNFCASNTDDGIASATITANSTSTYTFIFSSPIILNASNSYMMAFCDGNSFNGSDCSRSVPTGGFGSFESTSVQPPGWPSSSIYWYVLWNPVSANPESIYAQIASLLQQIIVLLSGLFSSK